MIPKIDKLKHFYLWSIGLAILLVFIPNIYAYIICVATAYGWELYQKTTKTGKYELKDVFFGGVLPCILHFITTI